MTVNQLIDRYLQGPALQLRSRGEVARVLERHVCPVLGALPVADVDYDAVSWMMRRMHHAPVQANRALAHFSTVMVWAVRWKLRPQGGNPCQHVLRYREKARTRFLSKDEVMQMRHALAGVDDQESARFLLGLLYTGARVSELAGATVQDVQRGRIVVGQGKNGDERVVHLSDHAQALLMEQAQGREVGPLWRPGIDPASARVWRRERKRCGLADVRRHDLRHSFASAGLAAGMTLAQIGAMLGHRSAASTKRYAHLMDEEGVELANRIQGVWG